MGELTLVSGHTGKGKTTFLSEYTLDLALNGVRTLWGSFEMKLEALQKIQIMQLSRMGLAEEELQKSRIPDTLQAIPSNSHSV